MIFPQKDFYETLSLLPLSEYLQQKKNVIIEGNFHINFADSPIILVELTRTFLLFSIPVKEDEQKCYGLELKEEVAYRLIRQNNINEKLDSWSLLLFWNSTRLHLLPVAGQQPDMWDSILSKCIVKTGFLEQFKPKRRIDKGSSGTVFEVIRLRDQKIMAVKAFSKSSFGRNKKQKDALNNEVKLMRLLSAQQHENVLPLHQIYQSQNSIYLVMDLCSGGILQKRISHDKDKAEPETIRYIIKQILKGLLHLHSKGIAHRDIKLNNILLRDKKHWDVVIADFGLATLIEDEEYLFTRCGTPGYVAPQVIEALPNHRLPNCSCDIFSVGVIFHYLLTGFPLFEGETMAEVFQNNRNFNFELSGSKYQFVGEEAMDLLKNMLILDPLIRLTAEQALKHAYFAEFEQEKLLFPIPKSSANTVNSFLQPGVDMPQLSLDQTDLKKKKSEWRKASSN